VGPRRVQDQSFYHLGIDSIIIFTIELMFSPVSICLPLNSITEKTTDQIFMKCYGIDVHNGGTNR